MQNKHTPIKDVVREFDKLYVEHCSDGEILDGMVDAKKVKRWLRTTLKFQANQYEREKSEMIREILADKETIVEEVVYGDGRIKVVRVFNIKAIAQEYGVDLSA